MKKIISAFCAVLLITVTFSFSVKAAFESTGEVSWTVKDNTYSGTLQEAFAAIGRNGEGTVQLLSDVYFSGSCEIDFSIVFKGNYTLFIDASSNIKIKENGTVTIECNVSYDCPVTNDGKLIVKCTVKSAGSGELNGNLIETAHSWDDGTVDTAPTSEKNGIMKYICADCSMAKYRIIPAVKEKLTGYDAVTAALIGTMIFLVIVIAVCVVITKFARENREKADAEKTIHGA